VGAVCHALGVLTKEEIRRVTINTLLLLSKTPALVEFSREQILWAMEHKPNQQDLDALDVASE